METVQSEWSLERPVLAVDVVLFALHEFRLKVLMRRRDAEPFIGALALPGVAVRVEETLESAARRALREKAGWTGHDPEPFLEQLAAFDALYRDPRGRTVSIVFMGIIRMDEIESSDDRWRDIDALTAGSLPFDHDRILETAVSRLKGKLRYTNIARHFLSDTFRIEPLQAVYEAILKQPVNRSNFRNKLLKIGLIEQVTVMTEAVGKKGGRPPHLYRFSKERTEAMERDFL